MNVSAILVTRGNVDIRPVLESLPHAWEKVLWTNGMGFRASSVAIWPYGCADDDMTYAMAEPRVFDAKVYGRYLAIEQAAHDLIYVQDDDCIVSDPQAITDHWGHVADELAEIDRVNTDAHLVANMPEHFRHEGYTDSCLVGFGAAFHRDASKRAFARFRDSIFKESEIEAMRGDWFQRTCDVVFTTLTPRVLVDVPYTDREFASDPDRMWRQPDHVGERTRMLELARRVRDA